MFERGLRDILKFIVEERELSMELVVESLHSLEFLAIKVIMISLSLYHLYEYAVKTIF
ncbi:TPA: hypothetical protein HA351_14375 [Methanosarcinaceae archaeon]|nr:hypothetical protein [Methanosarcinaceae archaeon]